MQVRFYRTIRVRRTVHVGHVIFLLTYVQGTCSHTLVYRTICQPLVAFVLVSSFYRAMHFSAKRGIAIACRLSVCPSVRNVEVL